MRTRFLGLIGTLIVLLLTALPAAAAITTSVPARGWLGDDRMTVTVPVVATCDAPVTLTASVTIIQTSGRKWTEGTGAGRALCEPGQDTTIDVVVFSTWGPYKNGPATARVEVVSQLPSGDTDEQVVAVDTIKLKK